MRCHCTDGHERDDVVKHRHAFLAKHFKLEQRSHRWAQLTDEEGKKLEETIEKFPEDCHCCDEVTKKRECHIDTHRALEECVPEECEKFGGGLSIRRPEGERPVIAVGQDESTFHQCTFSKKQWKGPRGQSQLLPKSTGETHMVSAHQAREFGLGLGELLTDDVLKEVNQRRKGEKCESVEDAKSLCPDIEVKPMLASDPLTRHFHAGKKPTLPQRGKHPRNSPLVQSWFLFKYF